MYRQKQILLGNWSGDMTLKIKDGIKVLTYKKQREQPVQAPLLSTNLVSVSVPTCCDDPAPHVQPGQDGGDPVQPLHQYQDCGDSVEPLQLDLDHAQQDQGQVGHPQEQINCRHVAEQPESLFPRTPILDPSVLPSPSREMYLPDGAGLPTALDCVAGCVGDRCRMRPCSGRSDGQAPVREVTSLTPVIGTQVGVAGSCPVPSTVTISITSSPSSRSCHTVV